ncbi:MAG: c-type cytochrome, partial [Calothrix sp. SM1_5_4]|nr:c-type cytochrome [Calothrix sp. SM1_5_4]
NVGRRLYPVAGLLTMTILCMASARHFYRETALTSHKEAVKQKTAEYQELVRRARLEAMTVSAGAGAAKAKQLFQVCAACHSMDVKLVGPPLREIQNLYKGNPEGIVAWSKAPGKKEKTILKCRRWRCLTKI